MNKSFEDIDNSNREVNTDGGNYNETINGNYINNMYVSSETSSDDSPYQSFLLDINTLVTQIREQVKADIEARCGNVRILDMSQPMELEDIYTNVKILEKISSHNRKNIADLNDSADWENFERFNLGKVQETISGKDAIRKYGTLLILGKPGAGKTTFLKHVTIQCSRGLFQGKLVPFFITLKDFAEANDQPELLTYLNPLKSSSSQKSNLAVLEKILEQEKALICLDGLDEVLKKDSGRVIREIENLVHKYPDNRYLMTCRIAAKEYTFTQFTEVEIADFNWSQISILSTNWFKNKSIKAETFLTRLKQEKPIQELASSPLLLTLLCLAFEESGNFPGNRAGLYKEGLDALLKKWDASRGIERDKIYHKLWIQRKEDLLSKIAWDTFEPGEYFFKQDKAERYIGEYIRNLPEANTDEEALRLDSEAVLKSVESQHGLLVERAKHIYSFSHRTFQEYFAAREIILVRQSANEALQELVNHIFDRRWHEVFLLTVAMSPNAEKLVLLMKNKIDKLFENSNTLNSFLNSLNQKAHSPAFNSEVKTNNLFSSIIRSFYFATELNLSCTLATNIDQSLTNQLIDSPERELDRLIVMFLKSSENLHTQICKYHTESFRVLSPYEFSCLIKYVEEYLRKILFHPKLFDPIRSKKNNNNFNPKNNYCDLRTEIIELLKEAPCKAKVKYSPIGIGEEYDWEINPFWWIDNGEIWIQKIRDVFMKYRYIGNSWSFNSQEKELLEQYYFANQLLIECLHQDCYIRREVRQEIEQTLLLPIAEIEKRKKPISKSELTIQT